MQNQNWLFIAVSLCWIFEKPTWDRALALNIWLNKFLNVFQKFNLDKTNFFLFEIMQLSFLLLAEFLIPN